jgi:AmmeMemoRadiSam system protein A
LKHSGAGGIINSVLFYRRGGGFVSLVYVGLFPQLPLPAAGEATERAVLEMAAAITGMAARYVVVVADPRILPSAGSAAAAPWPVLRSAVSVAGASPGAAGQLCTALEQAGWRGQGYALPAPSGGRESLGRAIAQALNDDAEPCALLACGRLSDRSDGAGEEAVSGKRFADFVLQGLRRDTALLRGIPPHLLAGQNVYDALLVALGAREGAPRVLAHEVIAGTGFVTAEIYRSSPVAGFARACLTHYLAGRAVDDLPVPGEPLLHQPAGCFVTLKKEGDLRGCIGTVSATRTDLAAEIKHNAVAAATQDPRFWPVVAEELPLISVSVDVLGQMEKIDSVNDLDPYRYGVVVRCRSKVGLLLPRLEGVEDARQQVDIARQKAGVWPEEEVELWRFRADRYYE